MLGISHELIYIAIYKAAHKSARMKPLFDRRVGASFTRDSYKLFYNSANLFSPSFGGYDPVVQQQTAR
jgi:hypothetical protein